MERNWLFKMKKINYAIKDELGIHARPAGQLVKEASAYTSKITISKDGKEADAKRLFNIMGLGVKCGDVIEITADGEDEDTAIQGMEKFFQSNL